ncbi:MAG TPA: cytochrome b/b6 domain-containing protein [Acetobacteraceae bacterium]|nr:cytochrome b/b6 domain-containing protein [Acetobacteraceae bacterium]
MPSRSAWFAEAVPNVPVWDCFVRLFHWGTASLVLVAFLTTDGPRWLHEDSGYAVLVLVAARILWGLVGTRHARFVSFLWGPRAVLRYLTLLRAGRAPHYLGHNPAGAVMVFALLGLLLFVSGSGWLSQTDAYFGLPWLDHLHHVSGDLLLGLIGVHLAGVAASSWLHRENLVLAMITGRKRRHLTGSQVQHEHGAAAIAPRGSH